MEVATAPPLPFKAYHKCLAACRVRFGKYLHRTSDISQVDLGRIFATIFRAAK